MSMKVVESVGFKFPHDLVEDSSFTVTKYDNTNFKVFINNIESNATREDMLKMIERLRFLVEK